MQWRGLRFVGWFLLCQAGPSHLAPSLASSSVVRERRGQSAAEGCEEGAHSGGDGGVRKEAAMAGNVPGKRARWSGHGFVATPGTYFVIWGGQGGCFGVIVQPAASKVGKSQST